MPREVAVELTLTTRKYMTEAAAADARTEALTEQMRGLDHEVEKTERDMAGLGATAGATKTQLSGFGHQMRSAADDVKLLDERIKAQKDSIAALGQEYLRTGDASILDKLKGERGSLRDLQRLRKELSGLAGDLNTVKKIALVDTFGNVLGSFDPIKGLSSAVSSAGAALENAVPGEAKVALIGLLVGAAAAAAPGVGAIISGAVVGAVGVGGLVGGIATAAKNPGVIQAAHEFGQTVSSEFFGNQASNAFAGPVIDALQILGQDFRDLDLGAAFAKAAPYVTMLAHGVGDFAKNIMPGFNAIMDKSGAITQILSTGLAGTGKALGDFLADVAQSRGSLEGLQILFRWINGAIELTGKTLNALGNGFDRFARFDAKLSGALEDILGWIPGVGDGLRNLNDYFEDITGTGAAATEVLYKWNAAGIAAGSTAGSYAAAAAEAKAATDRFTQALQDQNQAVDDNISKHLALQSAQLALAEGERTLKGELVKGKSKWKTGTEVGDANQAAVQARIEEANQVRLAQIALAGDNQAAIDKANAQFNATLRLLLGIAAAAGDSKQNLDQLAKTYTITIETKVVGKQVQDWSTFRNLERKGHAMGGYDDGRAPFWAGEKGAELIWPGGKPSYVMTHQESMAWAGAQARQWNGTAGHSAGRQESAAHYAGPSEEALARAVARAISGMPVVMDGRQVGMVQGRQADLLGRAF